MNLRTKRDSVKKNGTETVVAHCPSLTTTRKDRAMASKPLPPLNTLRQLLRYNAETGEFFWLKREPEFSGGQKIDARTVAKRTNTRIEGKKAGLVSWNRIYLGILGGRYAAHRVAWFMHYGVEPKGVIDHINGNARDNRIENLRDVTAWENARNMSVRSSNKSGYNGVSWSKKDKRWRADGRDLSGKKIYLGNFKNIEAAVAARKLFDAENGYHANHGRRSIKHENNRTSQ